MIETRLTDTDGEEIIIRRGYPAGGGSEFVEVEVTDRDYRTVKVSFHRDELQEFIRTTGMT